MDRTRASVITSTAAIPRSKQRLKWGSRPRCSPVRGRLHLRRNNYGSQDGTVGPATTRGVLSEITWKKAASIPTRSRSSGSVAAVGCCGRFGATRSLNSPDISRCQIAWTFYQCLCKKKQEPTPSGKRIRAGINEIGPWVARKRKAFWEARFAVAVANCNAGMISRSQHITD